MPKLPDMGQLTGECRAALRAHLVRHVGEERVREVEQDPAKLSALLAEVAQNGPAGRLAGSLSGMASTIGRALKPKK